MLWHGSKIAEKNRGVPCHLYTHVTPNCILLLWIMVVVMMPVEVWTSLLSWDAFVAYIYRLLVLKQWTPNVRILWLIQKIED